MASKKSIDPVYDWGVTEGRSQMRGEILTYLEEQYMKPEVTIDGVEGQAILKLTRDIVNKFSI